MKNKHLSRAVASQKFYEFRIKLKAKSRENGIELRVADRWYPSSKICHCCGTIKKDLKLSDRTFRCHCGYVEEKLAAIVADGKMLDDKIGYLAISEFTGLTSEQFQKVYQSLQDQGMERLIIDLRGNPGGLVTAVCDTLRQILPEGLIVYTEDKNGKREEYTCDGDTPISIPLVVLVNENTASAAEIFTGAVKDYGIGTIVGTTTFGKGIVQNTFQLSDGSVVKLTIAHYYTPLGNDIHKVGITPDVEVELPDDATSDVQLEKALEVVKGLESAE